MNIKIIGDNIEITEAISDYIHKRVETLQNPMHLHVMEFRIGKENHSKYIKFFSRDGKKEFSLIQKSDDVYYGIDLLIERIKRAFCRSKEKGKTSFRKKRIAIANKIIPRNLM